MAELLSAAVALTTSTGELLLAVLLLGWVGLIGAASWSYYRAAQAHTKVRLEMTHATIEQMLGHRTRLAQQPVADWHKEEEDVLVAYHTLCQTLDRRTRVLTNLAAPVFLLVGLVALLPAWVGAGLSSARAALSIAGLLFAYQALGKLTANMPLIANAIISWQKVGSLFNSISEDASSSGPLNRPTSAPGKVLLQGRGLSYRYAPTTPQVLEGCELTIRAGDHILLEGPSGSGKSTLMALLAGLQQPTAGVLLLDGLDHFSIGLPGWRRRVVAAPQFHDNHILVESLAFNLLLGRGWPPAEGDLAEAEAVCHELGLAPLLQRMPAGLHQLVGDSGWQLSHGEKSRIYIARALLQRAEIVVLDESFAALDPETLAQALKCVQRRAATLLVIAHP